VAASSLGVPGALIGKIFFKLAIECLRLANFCSTACLPGTAENQDAPINAQNPETQVKARSGGEREARSASEVGGRVRNFFYARRGRFSWMWMVSTGALILDQLASRSRSRTY
jgi:hypothetical protein